MKTTNIISCSIIACILLHSCKSLIIKSYGVKKPSFETEESVMYYLNKNFSGMHDGLFIMKDSLSFFWIISKIGGLPVVAFVNHQGQLIDYSDSTHCPGKAEKFLESVMPNSIYNIDTSYSLHEISQTTKSVGEKITLSADDSDIVLLIYWAKYLGKVNSNVYEIANELKKNQNIRSKVYFINLDFQKEWEIKSIPEIHWK